MKVLTIHQPWAGLLVGAFLPQIRDCETRKWETNYRGLLLVHAGLASNQDDEKAIKRLDLQGKTMPIGCIIGAAELFEVKRMKSESEWQQYRKVSLEAGRRPYGNSTFVWFVKNRLLFEKPIECLGALKLWDLSKDLEEKVQSAMKTAKKINT